MMFNFPAYHKGKVTIITRTQSTTYNSIYECKNIQAIHQINVGDFKCYLFGIFERKVYVSESLLLV